MEAKVGDLIDRQANQFRWYTNACGLTHRAQGLSAYGSISTLGSTQLKNYVVYQFERRFALGIQQRT